MSVMISDSASVLCGDVAERDERFCFENSTAGSTYDEIPVVHEGDDLTIAFNNRYLIDSLRSCTADKIKISMTSALTSINVEPLEKEDDHSELFFLLPVRMKE